MLARPFKVTTTKQIPDSAGYSVLGDEYFIDADLYRAILAGSWRDPRTGKVHITKVRGLTPMQVIQCLLKHERTEKCILDADNPINAYPDAHEFATLAEHTQVKAFGGRSVDYERALAPVIAWNQVKPLNDVPPDLSCAPLLDDPDAQDKITLRVLDGLGIQDADKISKKTVEYGPSKGADKCSACANWASANRSAELSPCKIVDGAVRTNYWCTKYQEGQNGQGLDQGRDQAPGRPAPVAGGPAGAENPSQQGGGGDPLQQSQGSQAGQLGQNSQGNEVT